MDSTFGRAVVGVVILAIAIFAVVRAANTINTTPSAEEQAAVQIQQYANEGRAVFTVDGPIVGLEEHRAIRISVDADERRLEVIRGYQNDVIQTEVFPNDTVAFSTFLAAIEREGFTKIRNTSNPERPGVCPEGRRYSFALIDAQKNADQDTWYARCNDTRRGTFGGDRSDVEDLFEAQIPDFKALTKSVDI